MADAWCSRRHPVLLLLSEFEKIEIITTIFLTLGPGKGLCRNGKQRKPRWQCERFLRPRQDHVNAEGVHVDLHSGKRGDGVEDEDDIGIFGEGAADFG